MVFAPLEMPLDNQSCFGDQTKSSLPWHVPLPIDFLIDSRTLTDDRAELKSGHVAGTVSPI